jgi:hypothetical protein
VPAKLSTDNESNDDNWEIDDGANTRLVHRLQFDYFRD